MSPPKRSSRCSTGCSGRKGCGLVVLRSWTGRCSTGCSAIRIAAGRWSSRSRTTAPTASLCCRVGQGRSSSMKNMSGTPITGRSPLAVGGRLAGRQLHLFAGTARTAGGYQPREAGLRRAEGDVCERACCLLQDVAEAAGQSGPPAPACRPAAKCSGHPNLCSFG